jgi:hypothetical protein
LWGDGIEAFEWRKDVSDDELSDMRRFIRQHLWGNPSDYAVERGEGYILITHSQTGNTILELRRLVSSTQKGN